MNEYNRIHPYVVFFVKQKTAYELRISDWSSDVCSSDRLQSCSSRAKPQIPVRAPYEGSGVTKEAKLHKSAPGLSPSHCQPPPRSISSPHVAPLYQRVRQSVLWGKRESVRVDHVTRSIIKKKRKSHTETTHNNQ